LSNIKRQINVYTSSCLSHEATWFRLCFVGMTKVSYGRFSGSNLTNLPI